MPDNQDINARLDGLEREIRELRQLLVNLETRITAAGSEPLLGETEVQKSPGGVQNESMLHEAWPEPPARIPSSFEGKWDSLRKEGLENIIGGRLLNRIGIIVLLFAAGYFLKYSFDNNWIGPAGRVIIGYFAGIGFLAAGYVMMNKGYEYFSQGFSGGAMGIIYLSTFFAVGSYHLIDRMPAFAILVITALTGGILAVRQSAYGVAFLAAVGGFMAPFLIGRTDPNTIGLLTYIAILNLGVLFIAKHKNWRSLNIIAFIATWAVYWIYKESLPYGWDAETWIFQAYATLFFLIFGALAFVYNVRNKEPARVTEVFLLTMNSFAYFIASYESFDTSFHFLLGPIAIVLAAAYLAVSLVLTRKEMGDRVLHIALLGTGLTFVTMAIPLQLQDEWIYAAWLVEAGVVFYGGTRGRMISLRIISFLFAMIISLIVFADSPHQYYYYDNLQKFGLIPVLNYYFMSMLLTVLVAYIAAYLYNTSEEIYRLERHAAWPAAVLGTIFALLTLSSETVYALHYCASTFSSDFAVSISWVVFAIAVMTAGMLKEIKGIRFLALGLFGIIICKVMLFDLSNLPIILRVLILLIVGAILVAVSFIYQRKSKGEERGI